MKETYYFPHDNNAHKDPKCSALINDFGVGGYGLYRALIEIMHEQGGKIKKFPKLFDGLAFQLQIDKEALVKQIEAMLHDYELLVEDENYLWSQRVIKNIEERHIKKQAKIDAGRIGGLKSGEIRKQGSKTKQNEAPLEANEPKESKLNKNKLNKNNILPDGNNSGAENLPVYVPEDITIQINELIKEIKQTAQTLGIAYDKTKEREFAKHLLTAIEYGKFCENVGIDRKSAAIHILRASVTKNYWRGPAAGPKAIYQHYAEIYNLTKQAINKEQITKIKEF